LGPELWLVERGFSSYFVIFPKRNKVNPLIQALAVVAEAFLIEN
jgi:hypothetical protein